MGLGIRRALRRIAGRVRREPAPTELDVRGVPEPDLASAPASVAAPSPASPVEATAKTELGVRRVDEPPKPSRELPADSVPATDPMVAKQKKHWAKTRKGVMGHLAERGGSLHLSELHGYSEQRFFVGHAAFSRLLEELVGEGLVTVDDDTGSVTLTDAGRA